MSQSQSGGSQRRCHRCYKARVDPKSARHGEGVEAHPDAGDTSLHSAQIASCPRHRRAIVAAGLAIDALRCEGIDESVVGALRQIVEILDTDNFRDGLRLGQLFSRDGAEADMPNQSLLLEFGKRGKRLLKGFVLRRGETAKAQIDDMERIEPEIAEVVVNRIDNFLT